MTNGFDLTLAFLAAVAGGAVNALAGGGTLITFPVLTALGVPAVAANVTNTVALCPGYLGGILAQSKDLRGQKSRLLLLLPAAMFGGIAGGLLLLRTGEKSFRTLVPFLILLASILLAVQDRVRSWIAHRSRRSGQDSAHSGWTIVPDALAAVYGGYFGAGLSVILLAVIGLSLDDTLTRLNALKQVMALGANLAAAIIFLFSGRVVWTVALVMAVGALIGGAMGGRLAGRVRPAVLRWTVVVIGIAVSVGYWVRWG
jgi:uncharacterized protein